MRDDISKDQELVNMFIEKGFVNYDLVKIRNKVDYVIVDKIVNSLEHCARSIKYKIDGKKMKQLMEILLYLEKGNKEDFRNDILLARLKIKDKQLSDISKKYYKLQDEFDYLLKVQNDNDNKRKTIEMYKPIVHNAKMIAINELETIKMFVLEGEKDIVGLIDKEIENLKRE